VREPVIDEVARRDKRPAFRNGGVDPWGSFNCGSATVEENLTFSAWSVFTTGTMLYLC
jgi:hypothetical protein